MVVGQNVAVLADYDARAQTFSAPRWLLLRHTIAKEIAKERIVHERVLLRWSIALDRSYRHYCRGDSTNNVSVRILQRSRRGANWWSATRGSIEFVLSAAPADEHQQQQ